MADSPGITAQAANSRIQWVERMACGHRNRDKLRSAIDFHLGGWNFYPEVLESAHSKT